MRIGYGGIRHETNTFSTVPTDVAKFKQLLYGEKEEVTIQNTGVRSYNGGFIDEAAAQGVELVPALFANAVPSGLITRETLESLRDKLVAYLLEAHREQPLDGIALTLHGAGVADGYPDIEGEIIGAIRKAFGPDMPIGVVLDLHGNITAEMVNGSDVLLGVKGYPHVDEYEAGRDMFRILAEAIRAGEMPKMRLVKLPWTFAPAKAMTVEGPAHEIQQFCLRVEREQEDVIHTTFFHGFPYSDIAQAGVSVVTIAKTQEAADQAALQIAEFAWERRERLISKTVSPAEAFEKALALETELPIVINESSDNPGGGAPGDGTHLLREMLKRNLPKTAFGFITDAEVAKQAAEAGVGATISCRLGGKTDRLHGEPIEIENAYVKGLSDGKFVLVTPMGAGTAMSMGLTALLQVGNVLVVVGSVANQTRDKCPFEVMGIDYQQMKILGLKSSQHFRGWWQERSEIVPCDPPGIHCGDLDVYDFKHLSRDQYPFVMDQTWTAESVLR